MSKNNNNTPHLRFPGFTGEWVEKKLGESVGSFKTGKLDANAMVEGGEYRFYTCAKDFSFIDSYAFEGDCIMIAGNGAHLGYVHHYNGKFNAYQRTYVLSDFNCDSNYLECCIRRFLPDRIRQEKKEGNMPYIVLSTLTDMLLYFPPSPEEQKKIADCLSEMDNLISAQSQKVELLKDQKKGMMQELFPQKGETTPRLRFPGFMGEWEEKRLKEIFVLRNGYTPLKGEDSYWTDGEIPWFRMEDIREKGNVLYDSTQHITQKAIKGKGCFNANTIILATSATIGEHALIKVAHLANQRFVNLEINPMYSREISIEYAYYYMYIIDEICKSIGNIGTFASVSTEALSNLLFVYPSTFAEQQKIANCLSELDDLIASETKQLKALKDHKKGLMQQLFPQPAK